MPQLDQYIFLHEVCTLTFFFFLIHGYARRVLIPLTNKVLKFRIKKINKLWDFDYWHHRIIEQTDNIFGKFGEVHAWGLASKGAASLQKYRVYLSQHYYIGFLLFMQSTGSVEDTQLTRFTSYDVKHATFYAKFY